MATQFARASALETCVTTRDRATRARVTRDRARVGRVASWIKPCDDDGDGAGDDDDDDDDARLTSARTTTTTTDARRFERTADDDAWRRERARWRGTRGWRN